MFSLPHIRRAALLKGSAVFVLILVVSLSHLWQHVAMVDLGYRVETARKQLTELSHQRSELLLEVASLSALGRVERIATQRLGLTFPAPIQLVRGITSPFPNDSDRKPLMLAANTVR